LRVIVPYVHERPEVRAALEGSGATYHYVGCTPEDYYWLLHRHWKPHGDLCVIEHDVVIGPTLLGSFSTCSSRWCTAPVPRHGKPDEYLTNSLSCVRFSAALIESEPDLMDEAATYDSGMPPRDWHHLDASIDWVLRRRKHAPHIHGPPLVHLPYPVPPA
jgi:hypothetical protein